MSKPKTNVYVTGPKKGTQTYKTVILKSNLGFAEQIGDENTVYVIKWDFNLSGSTVEVPENCVLKFEGGSLTNGTLNGQDTYLIYCGLRRDILRVTLEGTFTDNYYTKSETDTVISAVRSDMTQIDADIDTRTRYGTEADYTTKVAPADYEKGDVFYTVSPTEEGVTELVDNITYYVAKSAGHSGDSLTNGALFESTQSAVEASCISGNIKFPKTEELENYYNKTEANSQTAEQRNLAAIMAIASLPGCLEQATVTTTDEWKLVYTDRDSTIMVGKRQDNSWYFADALDAILDSLIATYEEP